MDEVWAERIQAMAERLNDVSARLSRLEQEDKENKKILLATLLRLKRLHLATAHVHRIPRLLKRRTKKA